MAKNRRAMAETLILYSIGSGNRLNDGQDSFVVEEETFRFGVYSNFCKTDAISPELRTVE